MSQTCSESGRSFIRPASPADPGIAGLIARHVAFAVATTPPENVYALNAEALSGPAIRLFGLFLGDTLAGMGALGDLGQGKGELKSMHILAAFRGRGLARQMLNHLIGVARERGMTRLWLETGSMEAYAPARTLYRSAGFAECGPYADYPVHPNSTFMYLDLRTNAS